MLRDTLEATGAGHRFSGRAGGVLAPAATASAGLVYLLIVDPQLRGLGRSTRLHCGNCGSPLDMMSDVGLKTDDEKKADAQWTQWKERYTDQLNDFVWWLERFSSQRMSTSARG